MFASGFNPSALTMPEDESLNGSFPITPLAQSGSDIYESETDEVAKSNPDKEKIERLELNVLDLQYLAADLQEQSKTLQDQLKKEKEEKECLEKFVCTLFFKTPEEFSQLLITKTAQEIRKVAARRYGEAYLKNSRVVQDASKVEQKTTPSDSVLSSKETRHTPVKRSLEENAEQQPAPKKPKPEQEESLLSIVSELKDLTCKFKQQDEYTASLEGLLKQYGIPLPSSASKQTYASSSPRQFTTPNGAMAMLDVDMSPKPRM